MPSLFPSLACIKTDLSFLFFWIAARKEVEEMKAYPQSYFYMVHYRESGKEAKERKSSKATTQTQIFVIPFYASASFLMWKKYAKWNLENLVSFFFGVRTNTHEYMQMNSHERFFFFFFFEERKTVLCQNKLFLLFTSAAHRNQFSVFIPRRV